MPTVELFILAVGLAMDAFAVSICKGLSMKKVRFRDAGLISLYFGIFQAGMPLLGYLLGAQFAHVIKTYDHWIAFILLGAIGANMIRGAYRDRKEGCSSAPADLRIGHMLLMALATSVDALVVGITLAFIGANIGFAAGFIGVVTLVLCFAGVYIGHSFGGENRFRAQLAGGVILILIGLKTLLEHMGWMPFGA